MEGGNGVSGLGKKMHANVTCTHTQRLNRTQQMKSLSHTLYFRDYIQQEQEEAKALLREIRSMEGQEEDEEVGGGERGGRESIGAFRVFENEESFMDSSFSSTEASRVEATPDFNSGTSSRRMTRQQAAAATAAAAAAVAGGDRRGRRVTGARSPEI